MIVLKTTQEKVLGALQAVAGIVERRHTLDAYLDRLAAIVGDHEPTASPAPAAEREWRAEAVG